MSKNKDIVFLFLIDFSKESYSALNYLIKVAKKINASIELFYVHSTLDLSIEANSLSILRNIDIENRSIKRKLKAIVELIEVEDIPVEVNSTFGDITLEIDVKRKLSKKNLIVVFGKSNNSEIQKKLDYLATKYKGSVLVLDKNNKIEEGNTVVIGCCEGSINNCDLNLPIDFCVKTKTPIIVLQSNYVEDKELDKVLSISKGANIEVLYKTIYHSKMLMGVKEFINNNNVKMLCINRENSKESLFRRLINPNKSISELVKEIHIPVLIMGTNK